MSRASAQVRGSTIPGTSARATSPTATHGRRSTGVADTAASLTIPVGRRAVDDDQRAGAGLASSWRSASASGVVGGTATDGRTRSRRASSGSRRGTCADAQGLRRPVPQDDGEEQRPAR